MKRINLEFLLTQFKLVKKNLYLKKVFLLFAIIEQKTSVHLGVFNQVKCFMIMKKNNFYENAVVKVYDIPIFYSPKLSHPDPTVIEDQVF